MRHLILTTLILTLALMSAFGQKEKRLYLTIDPATGNLFDPDPYPETDKVGRNEKIYWISRDPNIKSFTVEGKPVENRKHIFKITPEGRQSNNGVLEAEVAALAKPFGGKWEYTIVWSHINGGRPIRKDPKIAVRSIGGIFGFTGALISLGFVVACITSLVFYTKRKTALEKLKMASTEHQKTLVELQTTSAKLEAAIAKLKQSGLE